VYLFDRSSYDRALVHYEVYQGIQPPFRFALIAAAFVLFVAYKLERYSLGLLAGALVLVIMLACMRLFGVRIEDDILVTADGHVNLTGNIPKTIDEIESSMATYQT